MCGCGATARDPGRRLPSVWPTVAPGLCDSKLEGELAWGSVLRMGSLGGQERGTGDHACRDSCLLALSTSGGADLHSAKEELQTPPPARPGGPAWAAGVGKFQPRSGSGLPA